MTIFVVETYVVKPDKLGEFAEFGKKYIEWTKKRPDLYKDLKSWKLFTHVIGGVWGGYVEMSEFENLADAEKHLNMVMQDKEFMTEIYPQIMALIVPGTLSMNIWMPVA